MRPDGQSGDTMAANHNSHYKLLFSHPELIRDLLVDFVPVVRPSTLRLDTLQRVTGSYTGDARYEDMAWKVRLADQWLYVYLLLEFQSRSDEWIALRMHVYVSLLLRDLQRQKQVSPDGKLPPVLPIVVCNGAKAWNAATDLAELLTNAPEGLQALQPAQRHLVISAGNYPLESLNSKPNLVAALFRLEYSRTTADMERVLLSLSEWLTDPKYASLRQDFSRFASWRLRRQEILVGEARLLHRLLEHRFGSLPTWAEARLAEAMEEDLLRWCVRLLDPTVPLEQLLSI